MSTGVEQESLSPKQGDALEESRPIRRIGAMTDETIKAERQTVGEFRGGDKWKVSTGVDERSLTREQRRELKKSRQFATREEREQFLKDEKA